MHAAISFPDLLRLIAREVTTLDPKLASDQPQTVRQRIEPSIFQERMLALLSACFGILPLALAAMDSMA